MGQVVTSAEMARVIDANLKSYVAQVTGSYARLFGKSPTFVTYYTRDAVDSIADVNLGGAIQLVGRESPIRYHAVHDFPIYGVPELDATSNYEEIQGLVTSGLSGEAYILPGTIEPSQDDFFVIKHLESKFLFRCTNASPDRIEGKAFFKIEYILDNANPFQLERQTTKSFAFELGSVGTDVSPLVEMDLAVLLRETEVLEEYHRIAYWRAFYDRASGALLLRTGEPSPVHDRSVDLFVRRNDLLGGQGYMKSRTINPVDYFDRGVFEDILYPRTVYWWAEKAEAPAQTPFSRVAFAKTTPRSSSPFFGEFAVTGYNEAMHSEDGPERIGGDGFLDRVAAADFSDSNPLRSLAARCLSSSGFLLDDRIEAVRQFNALLNDASLLGNRRDYFWLMPIVLMRAKRFHGLTTD